MSIYLHYKDGNLIECTWIPHKEPFANLKNDPPSKRCCEIEIGYGPENPELILQVWRPLLVELHEKIGNWLKPPTT